MSDEVVYSEVKFIKKEELHNNNPNAEAEVSIVHGVTEVNIPKDDNQQIHKPNVKSDTRSHLHCAILVLVTLCSLLLAAVIALILLYRTDRGIMEDHHRSDLFIQNQSELCIESQACPTVISNNQSNYYNACPKDWEFHGGKCYLYSKDELNWTQSRDNCISMGGHLAIINSKDEQEFITKSLWKNQNKKFWIGLTDEQEENRWLWVDNTPLNEQNKFWMRNEPDNWEKESLTGEDCVHMSATSQDSIQGWSDDSCTKSRKRICETLSPNQE